MKAAAAWLAAMSFFFYGYWAPAFLLLLFASIAINYAGGIGIYRNLGTPRAKLVLVTCIVVDLALLGYFKYYNFFADTLNSVAVPVPILNVILPIGISFYTFTQIAFLVDTCQGKVKEFRPVHYALFVTYFPHLIAGPILHHSEMMPQFADPATYRPRLRTMAIGVAFLAMGMAKKVLLADSVSGIADTAFTAAGHGSIGMAHAWEGALAYTMQIYYDFSGYSDMAVGVSLLFGIQLPFNFDSPYKARNIIEFWRRWHMTLSRFLRDYLYIALGGNRRGHFRRYVNLFLTMLLGGLWHGAAWTFVIWGALHGIYLIINHGWQKLAGRSPIAKSGVAIGAGWIVTMVAVIVGWVFFRAVSVAEAMTMLRAMAGHTTDALAIGNAANWTLILTLGLIAVMLPNSQHLVSTRIAPAVDRSIARRGDGVMIGIAFTVIFIVWLAMVMASRANSAFIYFNF
ncbi:MBOAT family O-acyltransferase [Sphingobium sp. SCG-1]|uniref:MBOAT family O-acyltransferase n=1 Tax=Sphingobium sp. SCG-1 TaxID=2072936 RepID=UPI001CB994F4|nr:MBOAT family protein [Sphingobium sp. SCG-1]